MNRDETIKTMGVLRAAYPMFYSNMSAEDAKTAVELWNRILADYDYSIVNAAIVGLISTRTSTFPPVPGEVVDMIHRLSCDRQMDGAEAWGLVSRALRNSLYGFHEEFRKLPPAVQAAVGSENQLREWAMMDAGEVATVVASNFQKAFRITAARERELAKLPESVKEFVGGLLQSGGIKLLGGENEK